MCLPPLLSTTTLCNACTLHPATLLLPLILLFPPPCYQVLGDGEQLQAGGLFSRQRPNKPAIACLTWSMDNYQLASLDATSVLRMFWMRPFPGRDAVAIGWCFWKQEKYETPKPYALQRPCGDAAGADAAGQDIKENDGPKRQPVLPELAMSMGPMMMAVSGVDDLTSLGSRRSGWGAE